MISAKFYGEAKCRWGASKSATFVDFCMIYTKIPPYFYFLFVWPTDIESTLQTLTPTVIISSKFEVDMAIQCRVIAFSLLTRYVTVWHLTDDDPRLNMSHEGAARVWHLQPREVLFPCPTNYRVSYVLSYDQQDFLHDGGVFEGFAYKMAAFLRVLPTRWWRGKFAYKMAAMPRF